MLIQVPVHNVQRGGVPSGCPDLEQSCTKQEEIHMLVLVDTGMCPRAPNCPRATFPKKGIRSSHHNFFIKMMVLQ